MVWRLVRRMVWPSAMTVPDRHARRHGGDVQRLARQLGCSPRNILDFSASLVPFGPPRSVHDALQRAVNNQVVPYPDRTYRTLRQAIAAMHDLDPDSVLPGNGAAELLTWAARDASAFLNLLPEPGFADYRRALLTWGARCRPLPLRLDWTHAGPLDMAAAFRHPLNDARNDDRLPPAANTALWVTNPHNPTGQLWHRDGVEALLDRYGLVVVDEAFLPLTPGGERHSSIDLVPRFTNLVVIRSLTKLLAIAGLRLGYAVSHPERLTRWSRWRDPWPVNGLAVAVGEAAIADHRWHRRVQRWLLQERPWLARQLSHRLPLRVMPSAANYLLLHGRSSMQPLQRWLEQQRILVRDCSSFAGLDECWLRVAVRRRCENRRLVNAMVAGQEAVGRQPSP